MELADLLVKSTGGKLSRACLVGSGEFSRGDGKGFADRK